MSDIARSVADEAERAKIKRRECLIDELAAVPSDRPLNGAEIAKLFGRSPAGAISYTAPHSGHFDLAKAALARRDLREALYQTGRAIPELSDFAFFADRVTITGA